MNSLKHGKLLVCSVFFSFFMLLPLGAAETVTENERLGANLLEAMRSVSDSSKDIALNAAKRNVQPNPKIEAAVKNLLASATGLHANLGATEGKQDLRQEAKHSRRTLEAARAALSYISNQYTTGNQATKDFPLCVETQYYKEYMNLIAERIDACADFLETLASGKGNMDDYMDFARSKEERRLTVLSNVLTVLQAEAETKAPADKRREKFRYLQQDSKSAADFSEYANALVKAVEEELDPGKTKIETGYDKLAKLLQYKLKTMETESELAGYESRFGEFRDKAMFKRYAELAHGLLEQEKEFFERTAGQAKDQKAREGLAEMQRAISSQDRDCKNMRRIIESSARRFQKLGELKKELEQFPPERKNILSARFDEIGKEMDENMDKIATASREGRRVLECEAEGMLKQLDLEMDFVREELADEAIFAKATAKLDTEQKKKIEADFASLKQEKEELHKQARQERELQSRISLLQVKSYIIGQELNRQKESYGKGKTALLNKLRDAERKASKKAAQE